MPIIFHGTGSGGSAKKLKTARTINGTNFDGTANITTSHKPHLPFSLLFISNPNISIFSVTSCRFRC